MKAKKSNEFVISFRVSTDERNALLEQARKSGVNISQLMRQTLDMLIDSRC